MITRATKLQLVVFAIVTLVGATWVGGTYAHLDRLVVDRTFSVTVQLRESGGLFSGADVTYRGVSVGRVGEMAFNNDGVQATLDIDNGRQIPANLLAVVADKSAIGEQFIDLQPQADGAPYLAAGSAVPVDKTRIPLDTTVLLSNLDQLVSDVDPKDLRTVVHESGLAFANRGDDLAAILDGASTFIDKANANIGVTRQLIRDSSTALGTQIAEGGNLRAFSKNLALLSDTLVATDPDLRRLLGPGSEAITGVNQIVRENSAGLSQILANLRGPSEDLRANRLGIEAVLMLYPYLVQGTYTVLTPHAQGGTTVYNADFGLVGGAIGSSSLTPQACSGADYRARRPSSDITDYSSTFAPNCANSGLIPRRSENTQYIYRSAAGAAVSGKEALSWLLTGGLK